MRHKYFIPGFCIARYFVRKDKKPTETSDGVDNASENPETTEQNSASSVPDPQEPNVSVIQTPQYIPPMQRLEPDPRPPQPLPRVSSYHQPRHEYPMREVSRPLSSTRPKSYESYAIPRTSRSPLRVTNPSRVASPSREIPTRNSNYPYESRSGHRYDSSSSASKNIREVLQFYSKIFIIF